MAYPNGKARRVMLLFDLRLGVGFEILEGRYEFHALLFVLKGSTIEAYELPQFGGLAQVRADIKGRIKPLLERRGKILDELKARGEWVTADTYKFVLLAKVFCLFLGVKAQAEATARSRVRGTTIRIQITEARTRSIIRSSRQEGTAFIIVRDNCDQIEPRSFTRSFNQDEVNDRRAELESVSIQVAELEDELAQVRADIKGRIKPSLFQPVLRCRENTGYVRTYGGFLIQHFASHALAVNYHDMGNGRHLQVCGC